MLEIHFGSPTAVLKLEICMSRDSACLVQCCVPVA
jgi:hypothetical protein